MSVPSITAAILIDVDVFTSIQDIIIITSKQSVSLRCVLLNIDTERKQLHDHQWKKRQKTKDKID